MPLKLNIGDEVELKKNHPCGGNRFTIVRSGMDFRIRCKTCSTEIWLKRTDLEKRMKKIVLEIKKE